MACGATLDVFVLERGYRRTRGQAKAARSCWIAS